MSEPFVYWLVARDTSETVRQYFAGWDPDYVSPLLATWNAHASRALAYETLTEASPVARELRRLEPGHRIVIIRRTRRRAR